MIIVSSTGGSGSSFLADQFTENGWAVCLRPDGGHQKATHTVGQIYHERVGPFFKSDIGDPVLQREMFDEAYSKLQRTNFNKVMLLCMTWGGLGYLNELKEEAIFLIRDPIYAFNSYSGGGWRRAGGERRIKYVGASGPNDRKWIDAWLNNFSFWKSGAENALQAAKNKTGHLIRYHSFSEDWEKVQDALDVPPIHANFKNKDNPEKLEGYLTEDTISYIRSQTDYIWKEIEQYCA